jgi:hypothetical protein
VRDHHLCSQIACVCRGGRVAILSEADVALTYKAVCTHRSKIQIRPCLKAFRPNLLPIFLDTMVLEYYDQHLTTIPWFRNFSPKKQKILLLLLALLLLLLSSLSASLSSLLLLWLLLLLLLLLEQWSHPYALWLLLLLLLEQWSYGLSRKHVYIM